MVSVVNDKGHSFVRDGLYKMGYDRKTLRPYRTRRFNLSFHSQKLEQSEELNPLEILIRDTQTTNIDQDVTNMLIKNNGQILHQDDNGLVIYEHYSLTK